MHGRGKTLKNRVAADKWCLRHYKLPQASESAGPGGGQSTTRRQLVAWAC